MTATATFSEFADASLFLVWGSPSHGARSQWWARELGIRELHFIDVTSRRGVWVAPFKYALQGLRTFVLLFRKRPKLVFVQSPPGLAVLVVAIYCALTGSKFVVDAHSAALLLPFWTRPRWLWGGLARRAVATIVTNEHFAEMLADWKAPSLVVRDVPTTFADAGPYPVKGDFNVMVVNTFSSDEPLQEVLEAARGMTGVTFYVTGRLSGGDPDVLREAPDNVEFTDFLSTEAFYSLMRSGDAVMCLTTRDHTMQNGACEALSIGKPIITSNWGLLRDYFSKGTVHVDNTRAGIRQGVDEMRAHYPQYVSGIRELQVDQQAEWGRKTEELVAMIRAELES
jgi:glycosyltransferase involved in cell wall biosynthesis